MTNDLISREAAIAVLERIETTDYPPESILSQCIEALTNMPSAESELQEEIADLQSRLESWQHAAQYPRD